MHYPVLTDMDNGYALSLNLAIWVGAELQELMSASGRDLPRYQGNDAWVLPLPASFVVDADGYIRGRFIDPDYRQADGDRGPVRGDPGARDLAADPALVDPLPAPHRAYSFRHLSGIEKPGVKRNNSGSLRIGGRAAARTMGACR